MGDVVATLRSDRAANQSILAADDTNLDGDLNLTIALPPGFGDVLILNANIQIVSIATRMTMANQGVHWQLLDTAAALARDFLGTSEWFIKGATALSSYIDPDQLVVWRETEKLHLQGDEIDTNVTPTADAVVLVRVRRLRQNAPEIDPMHTDRLGRIVLTL